MKVIPQSSIEAGKRQACQAEIDCEIAAPHREVSG